LSATDRADRYLVLQYADGDLNKPFVGLANRTDVGLIL